MPHRSPRAKDEDAFLADYLYWLRNAGYRLNFHVIDSRRHAKVTSRGYPDVHSVHDERGILIAELKSERGSPTDEQWDWLITLARHLPPPPDDTAPSRVHLWRPSNEDWARTQMGTAATPAPCDCPVCRHVKGLLPSRHPATGPGSAHQRPRCPICGRATDPQTIASLGNCGNCPQRALERHHAALIAERIIHKVF